MNPKRRPIDDDRSKWSRWDVPGHRTLYGATQEKTAFREVIQYIAPALPPTPMTDLFDDVDDNDASTLDEQVAAELPQHGAMAPRSISKGWRDERTIYSLRLAPSGWFVDVAAAQSISAIGIALQDPLQELGVNELTLHELTGSDTDKKITTTIAEWVRSVILDDGSLPHGIMYRSKWGADWETWAFWLRRVDDGFPLEIEPFKLLQEEEIGKHTKTLVEAAKMSNMRIY
jgi:hypothetical protein